MRIQNRPAVSPAVAGAADTPVEGSTYTVIRANVLIPGRGDPIVNGAVVIRAAKIDWVGYYYQVPTKYSSAKQYHVPVVMPGLWDCHVHFAGQGIVADIMSNSFFNYLPQGNAQIGAITVADLRNTLMAGYTSVRELGGYGGDLWPLVKDGHLVGPNVYSSIGILSVSGGHGDDHAAPYEMVRNSSKAGSTIAICDGVDECMKTVRLMVRRGARCIKVCSSGGVLSLLDDPEDRQFSDEELRAIVGEASRSGRAVAAHAIGKAGIMSALAAGVTSIEHGMYLDEEAADIMVKKGTYFVGTHHIVMTFADNLDMLPDPLRQKVIKLVDKAETSYKLALKKGVKIALGTDTFSSDPSHPMRHGNNARELYWAVQMGMTTLQAIEASTANAAETLGGKAPLSGQLKEGYDADLIALRRNPLDDISVLGDGQNISHVWKGGDLYKQP
jgi:imidazolonepropionase-like amidohydrolase